MKKTNMTLNKNISKKQSHTKSNVAVNSDVWRLYIWRLSNSISEYYLTLHLKTIQDNIWRLFKRIYLKTIQEYIWRLQDSAQRLWLRSLWFTLNTLSDITESENLIKKHSKYITLLSKEIMDYVPRLLCKGQGS